MLVSWHLYSLSMSSPRYFSVIYLFLSTSSLGFSPFTSTMSSHPHIKPQSAKGPLGVCGKASPHLSSPHPGPCSSPHPFLSPFLFWSVWLLFFSLLHPCSLSLSLSLSLPATFSPSFSSFPPTNYLQDYRFSVGCD